MKKKAHDMYVDFQERSDAPAEKDPERHRPLMAGDSSDEEDDEDTTAALRQRHAHAQTNAVQRPSGLGDARSRGSSRSIKKND